VDIQARRAGHAILIRSSRQGRVHPVTAARCKHRHSPTSHATIEATHRESGRTQCTLAYNFGEVPHASFSNTHTWHPTSWRRQRPHPTPLDLRITPGEFHEAIYAKDHTTISTLENTSIPLPQASSSSNQASCAGAITTAARTITTNDDAVYLHAVLRQQKPPQAFAQPQGNRPESGVAAEDLVTARYGKAQTRSKRYRP
jgi:hypothetical protein